MSFGLRGMAYPACGCGDFLRTISGSCITLSECLKPGMSRSGFSESSRRVLSISGSSLTYERTDLRLFRTTTVCRIDDDEDRCRLYELGYGFGTERIVIS